MTPAATENQNEHHIISFYKKSQWENNVRCQNQVILEVRTAEKFSQPLQQLDGPFLVLHGDNPRDWSNLKKSMIAISVLYTAFVATFGTPIYVAAVPDAMTAFDISQTTAVVPISCHAFGLGLGALLFTAFSEVFGRRIVYRITAPLALIFTLISGSASDITAMSIARTLTGLFVSPALTVGGGIISDIWDISLEKSGTTFAVLYVMMIIVGTQTGPMVSAAIIAYRLSWRWVFWLPAILIGGTIVIAFCLPETYHPQLKRKHNEKVKGTMITRETLTRLLLTPLGRPLHMLLVEPTVLPTGLVMAVMQSVVFSYFTVYTALFKKVYHHTPHQAGMAFGALVIGSVLALPTLALFDRIFYRKHRIAALKTGTKVPPEKRLYPAMLGFITLPISLFWLAWTGRADIPAIVPTISAGLFGLSFVLNMLCLPIYNSDIFHATYCSSMLGALMFMRYCVGASFPLFTPIILERLGFAWTTSILGFATVALIPVPWVFFHYGPHLRSKSQYATEG
ncbi:hypothetical protein CJF32_00001832 [Rutstroemia sp. NJR-2017a WRK4]|nr:hypothetical protein CJF32_00001832 [Rutstroemia sp. NJR-2017a WRK4]